MGVCQNALCSSAPSVTKSSVEVRSDAFHAAKARGGEQGPLQKQTRPNDAALYVQPGKGRVEKRHRFAHRPSLIHRLASAGAQHDSCRGNPLILHQNVAQKGVNTRRRSSPAACLNCTVCGTQIVVSRQSSLALSLASSTGARVAILGRRSPTCRAIFSRGGLLFSRGNCGLLYVPRARLLLQSRTFSPAADS